MSDIETGIQAIEISTELKRSYLDYSMSVIVGRALPDARDGLKPVHRRVLFAMHELGNDYNKAHKKSARIVGDVIGKYHPHGDTAVYDTIVRMAQSFSLRYPLVDGQGNFGSIDGDSAAAMRYTEIRLSRIAHSLMADLEKETVDFVPNYDETEMAPAVFPTRIPNLLVNGSSGIAVGMATNIPPHNLNEVIDACVALLDNDELSIEELMQYIPGPDFPTHGIINGRAGIVSAYKTGRGIIRIRGRWELETFDTGREQIIITELPYQVNKAKFIENIAELKRDQKMDGVVGLRDESNKDGMRVVIELKRGENPEVVVNNLYMQTQLQVVFGINVVALVNGQPCVMNLKDIVKVFLDHRREVVTRRTVFDLRKAKERAHLLEGLTVALANIDEVIALIKAAKTPAEAKTGLLAKAWAAGSVAEMLEQTGASDSRPDQLLPQYGLQGLSYHLSPEQAQAILELRLHRLTGLEQDKILLEFKELLLLIAELLGILADPDKLEAVIRKELLEVKEQFGDARQTEIIESEDDLTMEDLIPEENVVVTLSHEGYVKYQPLDVYQAQRRGGKGKSATQMKEEDFIERLLVANTHDTILCFSDIGKVYALKVFRLPLASRGSRGRPIINILPLIENEQITAILPVKEFDESHFVFMATQQAVVKKVALSAFAKTRPSGIIAVELNDNDRLIGVDVTDGSSDIMLFSDVGKAIRFSEKDVRAMGRTACGVRGMTLEEGQKLISLIVVRGAAEILTATENGYGKRTALEEYSCIHRGGKGVISIQISERNGAVVSAAQTSEKDEVMLISDVGTLVRIPVAEISVISRNTQGVRLINLSEGEKLVGLAPIVDDE